MTYTASDVDRLRTMRENVEHAEARLRTAIRWMRNEGASWSVIGEALGVSKQAAQKRYGKTSAPAGADDASPSADSDVWTDGTVQTALPAPEPTTADYIAMARGLI